MAGMGTPIGRTATGHMDMDPWVITAVHFMGHIAMVAFIPIITGVGGHRRHLHLDHRLLLSLRDSKKAGKGRL